MPDGWGGRPSRRCWSDPPDARSFDLRITASNSFIHWWSSYPASLAGASSRGIGVSQC